MIVDAHHHVWRLGRGDYRWPTPDMAIHRDYGLDELRLVCGEVRSGILVQATPTEAETGFLLELAREAEGFVAGVVGWTDLAAADAAERIGALSGRAPLVGLRPMLQDLADARWILRPEVRGGLRAMADRALSLDLLIRAPQLPLVRALVRDHPGLRIVIDHAAKPPIGRDGFEPWATDIAHAARASGVFCKLSGLVTEAELTWDAATLRPFVEHLLACFGPARLMWGSDWPVVELAGGYAAWVEATGALLAGLSSSERAMILGGSARAFYRLDDDRPARLRDDGPSRLRDGGPPPRRHPPGGRALPAGC